MRTYLVSHRKCMSYPSGFICLFLYHLPGDTNVPCHSCQQSDLECIRDGSFRFQPSSFGAGGDWDAVFPERELWPRTAASCMLDEFTIAFGERLADFITIVQFCDQTSSIAKQYEAPGCTSPNSNGLLPSSSSPKTSVAGGCEGPELEQTGEYSDSRIWQSGDFRSTNPTTGSSSSLNHQSDCSYISPGDIAASVDGASLGGTRISPPAFQEYVPLNPREAVLMRNFTENMAVWVRISA